MDYLLEQDLFTRFKSNYKFAYHTLYTSAYGVKPHKHEHYEVLYCINGSFNVWINNELFVLHNGDVLFINKNDIHQSRPISAGANTYMVLRFNSRILTPLIQSVDLKTNLSSFFNSFYVDHYFKRTDLITASLANIMEKIADENALNDIYRNASITLSINELFLIIVRNWEKKYSQYSTYSNANHETMQIINNYIEENYSKKISMGTLAQKCTMSYTSFSRFVFKYTGVNFSTYVNNIRLKYASIMLVTTKYSITEIAINTGFSSPSYFSDYFKKSYGMTPQHFRNRFTSDPISQ